jgi:NAD(P)-dependent dehydrogenase (short-subunit alcohol dehydrogenase family)
MGESVMSLDNYNAKQDLTGKNAIVTGASRGLGGWIARALWERGANLILIARSPEALLKIREGLGATAKQRQEVRTLSIDLHRPDSVPFIQTQAREWWERLDILVNNAGILGPVGPVLKSKIEDWQATLRINLLVPVELCRASVAWMIEHGGGKIINVSGGGATSARPNFSAYAAAKAALVRFSETLAHEVRSFNVEVNCLAPGVLKTDMLEVVVQAGPERAGQKEYLQAIQADSGDASLERAANLCAFLASAVSDGITGKLISAVWDPWADLPQHLEDLKESDIYTLRRIIPHDRGKEWG